jgi:PAS domain S-box-containing protein
MRFDPPTVMTAFGVMWLLLSVVSTTVWWTRRHRRHSGFGQWTLAGLVLLLALFLLTLRPNAPEWVSMVCANAGLALASILCLEGAHDFRGGPHRRWPAYAAGLATVGVQAFFLYVDPNLNARAVVMSGFIGVVLFLTGATLLRGSPPAHAFGLRFTGGLFVLCGLTHLSRAAYYVFGPPLHDIFEVSAINRAFFVVSSGQTALLPVGFMLLADERVISDLQVARERASRADSELARHREAEAVLRDSERRFRTLADAAPVMIWASGPDKLCTYVNRPWLDFTGRTIDAELGSGWAESVHPDDVERCLATYHEAFDNRRTFRMEYRLRRYDGAYRWVLDSGAPVVGIDDALTGYVGTAVDITTHTLAREALSTLSGRLMEAQEKERARIARELHDDLAQRAATLALELNQVGQELQSGTSEHARLRDICDQTTDLARDIQVVAQSLHSAKLEILGLAPAASSLCRELSARHHVEIAFSAQSLPENLSKDIALCLFRVLQEALSNALKHASVPQVIVTLRGTPEEVHLDVVDRGVGFDPEAIGQRQGLGLISMQERLHLVEGEIHIASRPGAGTTIHVRVPLGYREEDRLVNGLLHRR